MDDVLADPDLSQVYASQPSGFVSWRDPVKEILWVSYTCRGGRVLNNAVVHDTQAGEGEDDLWHSEVSKENVLAMLDNFHPTPRKIVQLASEDGIKVHHLFKRNPMTSFVRGRTIIVGDAAHVMMPTHAAGGSIAVETAAALEVLFRDMSHDDTTNPNDGSISENFQKRLEAFDRVRVPRCNLTLLASNAGPRWLDVPGVEDEIRRFYQGPLPPAGSLPWGRQFRETLFNHDAYRAAEEALAALALGRQPPSVENGGT